MSDKDTTDKVAEFLEGYDERKAKKAERAATFADNASRRAQEHYDASGRLVDHIPLGQPILVGHHSEKAHRRAIERSHRHMDKMVEENARANKWRRVVKAVEGDKAIHYDDPEAEVKLREKIAGLKEARDLAKSINAGLRKEYKARKLTPDGEHEDGYKEAIYALEVPDRWRARLLAEIWAFNGRVKPKLNVTRYSREIKRLEGRLAAIPTQRVRAVCGRWLYYLKRGGKCAECEAAIPQGQGRAFWVRSERALYCEACGTALEAKAVGEDGE